MGTDQNPASIFLPFGARGRNRKIFSSFRLEKKQAEVTLLFYYLANFDSASGRAGLEGWSEGSCPCSGTGKGVLF